MLFRSLEYVNAVAGLESTFTEAQRAAGDVNGDNMVTVEDAQMILLYYVTNTVSGESVTWEQLLGFERAQYIRTSWSHGEYPVVTKITSEDALESYINANKKLYDLAFERSEKSFTEAAAEYTSEWFDKHQLVIVLLAEGSGSIRHTVSGVSKEQIQITRSAPETMTADMAAWFILIELDKSAEISDQVSVKLNQLDWDKKS